MPILRPLIHHTARQATCSTMCTTLISARGQLREYRIHHMTESERQMALQDQMALCHYKILRTESNRWIRQSPNRTTTDLVTLRKLRVNSKARAVSRLQFFPKEKLSKLQSVFSLVLNTLHFGTLQIDEKSVTRDIAQKIIQTTELIQNGITKKYSMKSQALSNSLAEKLISLYMFGDTTLHIPQEISSDHLVTLSKLILELPQHLQSDAANRLFPLISCVTATTVTDSCTALTGLARIPDFITNDVLERTPRSEYETELLLDLYQRRKALTHIGVLKSLLYYTAMYRAYNLEELTSTMLQKESALSSTDLNNLVFHIGVPVQKVQSKDYAHTILRSQKLVIDELNSRGEKVTASAYLGLAISLRTISPDRATQFHHLACQRIVTRDDELLEKRTRLLLSETGFQLEESFMAVISGSSTESELWGDFFRQAQEFDMLSSKRSTHFLQQTKTTRAIKHAQAPLLRTSDIRSILKNVNKMDNKSIAAFISRLYQHKGPINHFQSGSNAARHIFHSLAQPSRSITGEVLLGESFLDPTGAYTRYVQYTNRFCDSLPGEQSLRSLLYPAISHGDLKWENRKAQDLAIHEFRKVVKLTKDETHKPHIPSQRLWRSYILLCGRYGYHQELSEILYAWESTRFIPTRETLGMLLGALPDGVGNRIRLHGVKYLVKDKDDEESDVWDWPSHKQIESWRSYVLDRDVSGC